MTCSDAFSARSGFKDFVEEAVELVNADADATQARQQAADAQLDDAGALSVMRDVLTELLDDSATVDP